MKKTILKFYIIVTMLLASIIPSFALTMNIKEEGRNKVPLVTNGDSYFTVSVPKEIDITSGTANYVVGISGKLARNQKLSVEASSTVEMKEENLIKENVIATVTQEKKNGQI